MDVLKSVLAWYLIAGLFITIWYNLDDSRRRLRPLSERLAVSLGLSLFGSALISFFFLKELHKKKTQRSR